jgi:Type IV secretion system pilin
MCLTHMPRSRRRRRSIRGRRLALAGGVAVGLLWSAACGEVAATTPVVILAQAASVAQLLTNIRNWVVGILALLATVFLTIGGVRYILGNGDPGEIEKAKTAFRSACLGYALAVLAPLVVTVLKGIVGA